MGVVALAAVVGGLTSCGGEMPQVEQTSYETVTIQKQDITIPVKFSAKLKGETDVTITPQLPKRQVRKSSTSLTRICMTRRLSASIRSILQRTHTIRQRHPWHNTGHR